MKHIILKQNHFNIHSNVPYIEQYLTSFGINKISSFIDIPSEEDEGDPELLTNMNQAVKIAYDQLSQPHQKMFVMVDSDTDGYTSAAILIQYIQCRFPAVEIGWDIHAGKEHGIDLTKIPDDSTIIFIPDAGSNDFAQQETLTATGKTLIVLDHHEIVNMDKYLTTKAIIVNNQVSPNYPNKSLSGAGMVYKFIKLMDRTYFSTQPIYHNYGDLAAIGIIADAMNMTTLDNNYIAYWGLSHLHNKFIKQLAIKQARGIKNPDCLTKIDVAFYIAPTINGTIRSGSLDDKKLLFKALITNEDNNLYPHTWRGVTTNETLWELAVRTCMNAKSRQDAAKKKSFERLCKKVKEEHLDENNILIITLDEKESTKVSANITGLIAMDLVKEFNRPTLVLRKTTYEGKTMYAGSGRNGIFFELPDLKKQLLQAGCYYAAGHANAFGVFLLPEEVPTVIEYFNCVLSADVFNNVVYEVDYWFHTNELIDTNLLTEVAKYDSLWGNSLPQPKFAFDINYTTADLRVMGAKQDSLKISNNGVDFVIFKCEKLIKDLQQKQSGHITIIGRSALNEWNGRTYTQIVVDDIELYQDQKTVAITDLI